MSTLADKYRALENLFRERNQMAEEWELEKQWLVCPSCSAQSYVMPPHGMDPCPLVVQMMEGLGMKFDAERMAAIRTGVGFEEIVNDARKLWDQGEQE